MSRLLTRLLLVLAMLIGTIVLYPTVYMVARDGLDLHWNIAYVPTTCLCVIFFSLSWVLIWRGQVRWHARRRIVTWLALPGAAVIGLAVYGLIILTDPWAEELAALLGGWPGAPPGSHSLH